MAMRPRRRLARRRRPVASAARTLSLAQAAAVAGMPVKWIRRCIRLGDLRIVRGRVSRRSLRRLMAEDAADAAVAERRLSEPTVKY